MSGAGSTRVPIWNINTAQTTQLNLVLSQNDLVLGGNFTTGTTWLNATMIQSGAAIRITIGTVVSAAGSLVTTTGTGTMTWRPSTAATDLAGNAAQ